MLERTRTIAEMSAPELVNEVRRLQDEYHSARGAMEEAQFLLLRKMEDNGAVELVSETSKASLIRRDTYDNNKLFSLLELVPEEELVSSGAYIPEHTEKIGYKFNATKAKPFAKRGADIASVIEEAKIPGTPRLKITDR